MIVGGTMTSGSSKKACKTYLKMVQNVQLTSFIPKMARVDNLIIWFLEEDTRHLHHPHDDALVSIRVKDYNTHWILDDNGGSTKIIYYLAFQQMSIEREQLVPVNTPLSKLPVLVGDYPQQITKDGTFLVVDCSFAYNAILGRPTLNSWKAVSQLIT